MLTEIIAVAKRSQTTLLPDALGAAVLMLGLVIGLSLPTIF